MDDQTAEITIRDGDGVNTRIYRGKVYGASITSYSPYHLYENYRRLDLQIELYDATIEYHLANIIEGVC